MKNSARNFSAMNSVAMEMQAKSMTQPWRGKPYHAIANRNTKEDKGRSMIHTLYILQLAKRHVSG